MNKKIYWSLKLSIGIIGVVAIFKLVPYFMDLLNILVELFKLTDTTPEYKIILICISIWVTCKIMDVIVNICFKLQSMLKCDHSTSAKLTSSKDETT